MNEIIIFGNCLQNTVGLVRSMGEAGFRVNLLMEPCRKSDCFIRLSRYVKRIDYLDNIECAPQFLIENYASDKEKAIVLCGSDPTISLLDRNLDLLRPYFYIFNANDEQGRISYFLNKNNTFELAEKCGLTLINTYKVDNVNEIPANLSFPCFMKGNNSVNSTKGDIHICYNLDEMKSCFRHGVSYLVQNYIQKDFELNVIGFSIDHGNIVILPGGIKKIRESLVRMGEYMELNDIDSYKGLNVEGIKNFVREIGYEGIFSVEFLCKDDTYYFLEINLRNDGLAYIYSAAGANYPLLWYKYCSGELQKNELNNVLIKTPFYVMHENDMYNIVEGNVSIFRWVKDFIRSDAFLIMNWRDPMPFIGSTLIHVRQAIKKCLRIFCKK